MKKETLLTVSVVVLLLLNLGVVGYLLLGNKAPHNGPPHGPGQGNPVDRIVREQLHFSKEQDEKFEVLKMQHHSEMVRLDKEYSQQLQQYFALLKTDAVDTIAKANLETKLAAVQVSKAQITYQHFADLRALCTPGQKPAFDAILPQIMQVIMPGPGHQGPPPPRPEGF